MRIDARAPIEHIEGVRRATNASKESKMTAAAKDIAEMMNAWNKIQAAARKQFPRASEEEIYQIAKGAMLQALRAS